MARSIFISGSPGSGKSTTYRLLLESDPELVPAPSHLSRAPRPDERQGVDGIFVSEEEFVVNVQQGLYFEPSLETAAFAGNLYGSPRGWLDSIMNDEAPIISIPNNVVVLSGLCRVLSNRGLRERLLWVNLHTPVDVRRERLAKYITGSLKIEQRLTEGVSQGFQPEADMNIDTSLHAPHKVADMILERAYTETVN